MGESWVGRRALLMHKETGVQRVGIVVRDDDDSPTIFAVDEGVEVSALDWFYTFDRVPPHSDGRGVDG